MTNLRSLSLARVHACGLYGDGAVVCWGFGAGLGFSGDTQDGTLHTVHLRFRADPPFAGLDSPLAIATLDRASCAVLGSVVARHGVRCWGVDPPTLGIADARAIAAAGDRLCVRRVSGEVWCAARDEHHRFALERRVAGVDRATALAVGNHGGCAVSDAGEVHCWGDDLVPRRIDGLTDVRSVAAGEDFACALARDGTVSCWGDDRDGQLGDRPGPRNDHPTRVSRLSDIVEIAAGARHACARDAHGAIWCWGASASGRLGSGLAANVLVPRALPSLRVRAMALGHFHTCAITVDQHIACWGSNLAGQLGSRVSVSRTEPTEVEQHPSAVDIALDEEETCARTTDGALMCWGHAVPRSYADSWESEPRVYRGRRATGLFMGLEGPCEIGDRGVPFCWELEVPPLHNLGSVSRIVYRGNFLCSLPARSRRLTCSGHLRTGRVTARLDDVRDVSTSTSHICAVDRGGSVHCLGENEFGVLGPNGESSSTWVRVAGLTHVAHVAVGEGFSCALTETGTVLCWGANTWGQLGDGTTVDRSAPAPALGVQGAVGLAAGPFHACAWDHDGRVMCWGRNDASQAGEGEATVSGPVRVRWSVP